MGKMLTKRNYNSYLLCVSSLAYLAVGLLVITKNPYLAILLFAVTLFSILHHRNFKSFILKSLDLFFSTFLLLYILNIRFDLFVLILLITLTVFRLFDYILLKKESYGIFSYTHSLWHLVSGLAIVFAVVFA